MSARIRRQSKDYHIADPLPPTRTESRGDSGGAKESRESHVRVSVENPPRDRSLGIPARSKRRKVKGWLGKKWNPNHIAPLRNLQIPIDEPERQQAIEDRPGMLPRHGQHARWFPQRIGGCHGCYDIVRDMYMRSQPFRRASCGPWPWPFAFCS